MAVVFSPKYRSRERIMLFGREGTGKSKAAKDVLKRIGPNRVYVVDNDNAWERMIEDDPNADELFSRCEITFAGRRWEKNVKAIAKYVDEMGRDDWLVIDKFSSLWEMAQDWFVEEIHGEDPADYFAMMRRDMKEAGRGALNAIGGAHGVDWQVINRQYNAKVANPLLECPGHLISICDPKKVDDEKDPVTKSQYQNCGGMMPAGQKGGPGQHHTVLFLTVSGGRHFLTTAGDTKDRERRHFDREEWSDFTVSYLEGVAGWGLKVVE